VPVHFGQKRLTGCGPAQPIGASRRLLVGAAHLGAGRVLHHTTARARITPTLDA
jgi:hypothetical protein